MKTEIVYWKLEFDSMFFSGWGGSFNGACFANREDAIKAVEDLNTYFKGHYLSNKVMGRKIIHSKHKNNENNDSFNCYWFRYVVIDCHDYSQIISFGCQRHTLRLK